MIVAQGTTGKITLCKKKRRKTVQVLPNRALAESPGSREKLLQ
jgi:hypothetical protein